MAEERLAAAVDELLDAVMRNRFTAADTTSAARIDRVIEDVLSRG